MNRLVLVEDRGWFALDQLLWRIKKIKEVLTVTAFEKVLCRKKIKGASVENFQKDSWYSLLDIFNDMMCSTQRKKMTRIFLSFLSKVVYA